MSLFTLFNKRRRSYSNADVTVSLQSMLSLMHLLVSHKDLFLVNAWRHGSLGAEFDSFVLRSLAQCYVFFCLDYGLVEELTQEKDMIGKSTIKLSFFIWLCSYHLLHFYLSVHKFLNISMIDTRVGYQ